MSDAHRTALVDESFRRGSDGKRYFLMAAQRDGVAPADLVYRHGRPKEEPLLPQPMQQIRWIVP